MKNIGVPSAERKTGFIAFRFYVIGAILAGLYVVIFSMPMLSDLNIYERHRAANPEPVQEAPQTIEEAPINSEPQPYEENLELLYPLPHKGFEIGGLELRLIGATFGGTTSPEAEEIKKEIEQLEAEHQIEVDAVLQQRAKYVESRVSGAATVRRVEARKAAEAPQVVDETANSNDIFKRKVSAMALGAVLLMLYILAGNKYGILRLPRFLPPKLFLLGIPILLYGLFFVSGNAAISNGVITQYSLWVLFAAVLVPFLIFSFNIVYFLFKEIFKEWRFFERLTKTFSGRPSGRWGGFLSYWRHDVTNSFNASMGRKIVRDRTQPDISRQDDLGI